MKNLDEILQESKDNLEREKIIQLYKAFQKVDQKGGLYVTDFLTLSEQYYFQRISHLFNNLFTLLNGGIDGAERKRGFISDRLELIEYIDLDKYFIGLDIKPLENTSLNKFLEFLKEKEIEEEKIGDAWVYQNNFKIIVAKEMSDTIVEKLQEENIMFEVLSILDMKNYARVSKILHTIENSRRLDSIGSFALGISRSKMQTYIKAGAVEVNGKKILDTFYELKEGDMISVRGIGSFRINNIKTTLKGKYSIEIERLVKRK
ncbi:MAG: S4 domain-containing protein [Dictyoglomus sp.]